MSSQAPNGERSLQLEVPPPAVNIQRIKAEAGTGPKIGVTVRANFAESLDRRFRLEGSSLTATVRMPAQKGFFGVPSEQSLRALVDTLNQVPDEPPLITTAHIEIPLLPKSSPANSDDQVIVELNLVVTESAEVPALTESASVSSAETTVEIEEGFFDALEQGGAAASAAHA